MFTHHVALPSPQAVYGREARLAPPASDADARRPSDVSSLAPAPSLDSLDAPAPPAGAADEGFMALDHTWDLRLVPAGGETMRIDCEARVSAFRGRPPQALLSSLVLLPSSSSSSSSC